MGFNRFYNLLIISNRSFIIVLVKALNGIFLNDNIIILIRWYKLLRNLNKKI